MPLADSLKQIRPFSPFRPENSDIEACIRLARKGEFKSEDGQPIHHRLRDEISGLLSYLTPEAQKAVSEADIYVLPFTACLAFCEMHQGRKEIFISGGMINLIASHIISLVLEQSLPEALEDYCVPGMEHVGARYLLTDMLFVLNFRFYRYGEPLPNIMAALSNKTETCYRDRINGGILFLILHELGHLERGHLHGRYNGPGHYSSAIDEQLSLEKKQEHDADMFVVESLLPAYKGMATSWQMVAMNFFEQLEEITALQTDSHPLAINRSFAGQQIVRGEQLPDMTGFLRQEGEFLKFTKNFQTAGKRFDALKGHFLETTRQEALEILLYIDLTFLQPHFRKSIQTLWNQPGCNWLDIPLIGKDPKSGEQSQS